MSVAKEFSKEIHRQLRRHAAWLPVTNTFRVGDFGVIADGVFTRMGNIQDSFRVEFATRPGAETRLDFKSSHVRTTRIVGGAEVGGFAGVGELEASLKIEFGRERQFYVNAQLTSEEMTSTFEVARQLLGISGWDRRKFKVVSATYTGQQCLVLSSTSGGTTFDVSGSARALEALEAGKIEAGLNFKSSSTLGLEVKGETGVLALGLIAVNRHGSPDVLRSRAIGDADVEVIALDEREPDQLDDDI